MFAVVVGVAGAERFYVGSGGCDVLDHGCKDDPKSERLIGAVHVGNNGVLSWPAGFEPVDAGGVPSWLVTDGACTWAALHDTDMVAGFRHDDRGLALEASAPSGGKTPLYMELSPDGSHMFVANYDAPDDATNSSGASVAVFSRRGGSCGLEFAASAAVDAPSRVDPDGRQGASHIHSVVPSRRFLGLAYACDLGGDRIRAFRYDGASLLPVGSTASPPGAGPRHAREHPSADVLYVLHEMGSSLQAWAVVSDDDSGEVLFEPGPILPLLPEGVAPSNRSKAAELLVRGDFLFATVRGEHSAVVSVDVSSPLEPFVASRRTGDVDAFPRGAAFASDGTLLVAGQHGSTVAAFSVGDDGSLAHEATLAGSVPPFPAAFAHA